MFFLPSRKIPSIWPQISSFDVLLIALGQMCDETTISNLRTANVVTLI